MMWANNNGLGYTDSLVDMNEIARNENVRLLVHRVQSEGPILLTTGWAHQGSDDFLRLGRADLERQKRSGSNPLAQNDPGASARSRVESGRRDICPPAQVGSQVTSCAL